MKFWKEHTALRMVLILYGWMQTGKLWGFAVMLVGIGFLLGCLSLYNKPFEEPRTKKTK